MFLTTQSGKRYQATQDDVLWLLRAVEAEGEPRALVAQTLVNGFMWSRDALGSSRTLADWVRIYAQPVNPRWFEGGDKLAEALAQANEDERVRLLEKARKRESVHATRTSFTPGTKNAVQRALYSSPMLPEATDYAAAWVVRKPPWKPHGPPIEGQNRFWTQPRALGWTGYRPVKKNDAQMNTGKVAETLNNAIVRLDFLVTASHVSDGVKRSIAQLAEHWVEWWNSTERRALPPFLLQGRLERYLEWYTRAWMLAPYDIQQRVTHPVDIDTSTGALVEETIRQAVETYDSAGRAAKQLALDVARAPVEMVRDMAREASGEVVSAIVPLAALGAALALMLRRR